MRIPQHILVHLIGDAPASAWSTTARELLLLQSREGWEWVEWVILSIRDLLFQFAELVGAWFSWMGSTLQDIFRDPGAWMLHLFTLCYEFLCNHPHLVCVVSLCLFAGPVVLLLPFLLLHEIAILVLFNLNFVGHGLLPGRIEDHYDALKEHFLESRERTFASVDAATSRFNHWTTENFMLRLLRIAGGIVGVYAAWGLWEGRWSTPV